uniref:Uncharacterized protein n=1 Tax=Strombidinopsis acuminata TaxID=141414 RepID=A0A7S3SDH7_9SPIT|mmetsp:Transcript_27394/g.37241  ORF Transcript_27394/g.37241 Transcript_27394/m.37241 type:complete len:296 (+) Transcript_27394:610-1497(+)
MICYAPKFPYKGEGCDFYAFYYEHFMRQDKMVGRAARNAQIQYWTPNKEIFRFPYANEVALDECHKRGIDVMLGWEMTKVYKNEYDQKIAVFKNVDSGEIIEKDFFSANINPPSNPQKELLGTGLLNDEGLVDVNKYTLQHKTFENVFAFGDCAATGTTPTQDAAMAQNPIIKHNLLQFMDGKDTNAIYDGYTFMPLILGQNYATSFQHLHDYEPHSMNHAVPHYGIFSNIYFGRMMSSGVKASNAYTGFKKTYGPPHYRYRASFDPLESNEVLQHKGLTPEDVRHPNARAPATE